MRAQRARLERAIAHADMAPQRVAFRTFDPRRSGPTMAVASALRSMRSTALSESSGEGAAMGRHALKAPPLTTPLVPAIVRKSIATPLFVAACRYLEIADSRIRFDKSAHADDARGLLAEQRMKGRREGKRVAGRGIQSSPGAAGDATFLHEAFGGIGLRRCRIDPRNPLSENCGKMRV